MLERVKEIIEEQLNVEGVEITEETRFKEDLEADSLDLFELVMAFEEEYGVEIPSEDLEKITTVGSVIKYNIVTAAAAKHYRKYAFHVSVDTPFVLAELGNDAGIYGCAKMVLGE